MRDWSKTLRRASFRGVPFHVDSEEFTNGGRNVVTHEFVRSEEFLSEDMGRKGPKPKLKGYVVGDMADLECQALIAACCAPGAASLVMPLLGARQVICTDVSASVSREKLGYVEVSMEFVDAGSAPAFPSLPIGDRLAVAALETLAGLATSMVSRIGIR